MVKGTIIDAQTKEPLPFVNVVFVGKNIGTTTDYNGEYIIRTQWPSGKLEASFLGYKTQYKSVIKEKEQIINFQLIPDAEMLDNVVIQAKGKRYRIY